MKKTIFDVMSLAIGGMIGGGILYLNGKVVNSCGNLSPLCWLLGFIIALTVSFSFMILGLEYPSNEGIVDYSEKTIPHKTSQNIISIIIILGYICLISVYALSLGYYLSGYFKFHHPNILAVVAVFIGLMIHYIPKTVFKDITDSLVSSKILIMLVILVFGLYLKTKKKIISSSLIKLKNNYAVVLNILSLGLSSFLSFVGFEVISDTNQDLEKKEKNIPLAYFISIFIVGIIYIGISYITVKHLGGEINSNNQYASFLHLVEKFGWGTIGGIVILLLSLIANLTAINSVLFAKRKLLTYTISNSNLSKDLKNFCLKKTPFPWITNVTGEKRELVIFIGIIISLIMISAPEYISTNISSIAFLLVYSAVSYMGYQLVLKKQKNKKNIVILGKTINPKLAITITNIGIYITLFSVVYLVIHTILYKAN